MTPARALAYAEAAAPRFVGELAELIRFPTVSVDRKHAGDLVRCARWLAAHLESIGCRSVRVVPTMGHPVVIGEWLGAPGRPTVLVYGHYDVQPADPLHEWRSPPFEPTVRGESLYGRGASDDKGQLFVHVKAVESYLRADRLPVNVRFLLEGEEEVGSPSLAAFAEEHRGALRADVAVVSDSEMLGRDRPALTTALRGALGFDVEVSGARTDLHSGNYGGALHNPLQFLCELLAGLHDRTGRIAIPGFYDDVRGRAASERAALARMGPSDERVLADAGARSGWGEPGFSLYERITIRPALSVNGLDGGYDGPGGKGVIPARGLAKLSFRLVPDQNPREIEGLFRRHVASLVPPTVSVRLRRTMLADPVEVDVRHPAVRAAVDAYTRGFGRRPVLRRSGGTVPVVNLLENILGIPTVLMGFALPDDRLHAPNERINLPTFRKAIATAIWFLGGVGSPRVSATLRRVAIAP